MKPKKTVFNRQWLDVSLNPDFISWLMEVKENQHKAYCKVCSKSFELSNMGKQAIVSHAKGPTHIKNMKAKLTQQPASSFFSMSQHSNISDINEPSCSGMVVENMSESFRPRPNCSATQPDTVRPNIINDFVLKDNVTKAEALWAMQVVRKMMSFSSCTNVNQLFQMMFPDSAIANKFQVGSSKVAYVVSYGLAPHFHSILKDCLKNCEDYVVCFDESLNKIVQRGQMDLVVRFWDINSRKVVTRYLNSVFLSKATAADLLEKFLEGLTPDVPLAKLLQVSMDGPNVNLSFLRKLKEIMVDDSDQCKKELLDIGTCGIHVVHGAYKTGLGAAEWNINTVLRHMHYLFKDSPARRALYTKLTGSVLFPLKFCGTRWLENVACIDRAMAIFDEVKRFANEAKIPGSKTFETVKSASNDPLMKCKMAFGKVVASECESFLRRFQSPKPLAPFLYEDLHHLIRSLLNRCIKPQKLNEASSAFKLVTLDLSAHQNLVEINKIDVGFATKKFLKEAHVTEKQKADFLLQCRNLLTVMVEKLVERSPLKYKMVRGLSCFDPVVVFHKPKIGESRMNEVLETLHLANRISDKVAEKAKQQYALLCVAATREFQDHFQDYESKQKNDEIGLDTFYAILLTNNAKYSELWTVVKMCLILSHGNASVESGFSINKAILIENMHEETIVSQRRVYDAILEAGGVESVPLDRKLLNSVRSAYRSYQEASERKRSLLREEMKKKEEKKRVDVEIRRLEDEKQRVRKNAKVEEDSIDSELEHLVKKKRAL